MLVSIIIINYNTFDLTCNCMESIITYTHNVRYEIILVDNASTKDRPDEFIKRFPSVKLIKSSDNGGFAKGNNLGIQHASGDVILLLNSDTFLTEDSISIAAQFLTKHSDAGAISTKLTYLDGTYQSNARRFRYIFNECYDLLRPILLLLPYRKRATLMLNQYFKGDFNTDCDWVSGAFMMFRKSLLQQLPEGKLDERFFMYGEDQLWCLQIQELGYTNYYLSETSVVHISNASTEPQKQLLLLKTMIGRELEVMEYRKGKSLYYYTFKFIYMIKEMGRYYVKISLQKMFNYRLR
ncbi:MAG: glycosyltransferase family 2 protein [Bacteroidota bacterium]